MSPVDHVAQTSKQAPSPRVLVTGGAGFLGQALAAALAVDHDVIVFDVAPSYLRLPRVSSVVGDVLDFDALQEAALGCDSIFHLASVVGVSECQKNEGRADRVNTEGSKILARVVQQSPSVRRLVALSSSEIYGDSAGLPLTEQTRPAPLSVYGHSKLRLEQTVRSLAVAGQRNVVIIRPFNVYGPGQGLRFVVPEFCRAALTGAPMYVHGSGLQTRTFTYLGDAIQGILSAYRFSARRFSDSLIYNIAGRETVTIHHLARLTRAMAGSESPIVSAEFDESFVGRDPRQEVLSRVADTTLASQDFGFAAKVSLTAGIAQTIDWHRHHSDKPA